uniref:Uncharacterized protein n=1 Tax=Steinernema glaseri TaxID=37863 RepID=A0A1I7ZTR3_9BILA
MDTVPFAFSAAVAQFIPRFLYIGSLPCVPLFRGRPWNHVNLIRLSSPIWSVAAQDVHNTKYKHVFSVHIFPGEERGMCRYELVELTFGFPKVSPEEAETSLFLRSGVVNFLDWEPSSDDSLRSMSLREAFKRLVIPFCANAVSFETRRNSGFLLEVLQEMHHHQLVVSGLCLKWISAEAYREAESEFNAFLEETTRMSASKWIRKIARMISGRSALSASFSRRYEHKKGTEELLLWLETEASEEYVSLRGVSPNEL